MAEKHSTEFLERRKLQDKDLEISELKHNMKMEELELQRKISAEIFEQKMSFYRLKRADEFRKAGIRK